MSAPSSDEDAIACPLDRNIDDHGQAIFDAIAAATIRPLPPLPDRHPTRVTVPPSTASTNMATSTSASSASKGYHLHVILISFYSSHSICTIMALQLQRDVSSSDSIFNLFSVSPLEYITASWGSFGFDSSLMLMICGQ
jgi:hypothetical protein